MEVRRALYSEETLECFLQYQSFKEKEDLLSEEAYLEACCQVPLFDPADAAVSSLLDDEAQLEAQKEAKTGSARVITAETKSNPDGGREAKDEGAFPRYRGGYHVLHRIDGELAAFSVVDITDTGLSSLGCYYDPEYEHLKPAAFCALREIEYAQGSQSPLTHYYPSGLYLPESQPADELTDFSPAQVACPHTSKYVYLTDEVK